MTVISISINNGGADILSIERGFGYKTELCISPACDGFVSVEGINARLKDGHCVIDLTPLKDGELVPTIIEKNRRTVLPKLKKSSNGIDISMPDAEYIYNLSKRIRELESSHHSLSEQAIKLSESVWGTPLFKKP